MADYSFRIVGLTAPTQPAYIQSVRPALAVENTGVNPLILSGNFSVYQSQRPGTLIFQTGLIPTTVAPHSTAILLGQLYWLPPAAGTYNVAAHVTANRRNLFHDFGPLALIVTKEEPPEPPIVTAHATQHETGGADEVNVTNLRGECYDPQPPKDHAGKHEQGGADELNVNGLKGQLADAQPVSAHGNEAHTEPFATEAALTNHRNNTTAHALATNLEKTANKGQANGYPNLGADKMIPDAQLPASIERTNNKGAANGYAGLDAGSKVPTAQLGGPPPGTDKFLRSDQSWADVPSAVSFAAPVKVNAGFTNSEGQSTSSARADHGHSASGLLLADVSSSLIAPGQDAYAIDYNLPAVTEKLVLTMRHCAIAVSHLDSFPLDFRVNLENLNLHLVSWSIVAGQSLSVLVTAKIILDPVAHTVSSCLTIENVSVVPGQVAGKVDVYRSPATQWNPTQTNRIYLRIYNNSITTGEWLLAASAVEAQKV